jgi:hypothetical protein
MYYVFDNLPDGKSPRLLLSRYGTGGAKACLFCSSIVGFSGIFQLLRRKVLVMKIPTLLVLLAIWAIPSVAQQSVPNAKNKMVGPKAMCDAAAVKLREARQCNTHHGGE